MMDGDDWGATIGGLIERLRAGDASAREELLARSRDRLCWIARRMLRGYPVVARWEGLDDVVQNAMLRLDAALKAVTPPTPLDFLRLAAAVVRRELIDLARRYSGPEGLDTNHRTPTGLRAPGRSAAGPVEPPDTSHDPDRLASWTDLHRQIELLPDDERAVFDLVWYQGLTLGQAAAVLATPERTVRRRWVNARLRLKQALGGQSPGS